MSAIKSHFLYLLKIYLVLFLKLLEIELLFCIKQRKINKTLLLHTINPIAISIPLQRRSHPLFQLIKTIP